MNILSLSWASVRSRPLTSFLAVAAMAAGIALLASVLIISQMIGDGMKRNAQGIDLVAGAKGSPLQIVLSTVYHNDVPTSNIEMADYKKLAAHPQVKHAIPLAIGDNYKGLRVIGTNVDFLSLYKAEIDEGQMFAAPFQVVAGASTGLTMGTTFTASHGLTGEGGEEHHEHVYTVAGVLKPTGTVIDRLLVTPIEGVQELHEHHHGHEDHDDHEGHEEHEDGVTAVLMQVRTPLALMNLPRELNQSLNLTVASPSYEMARLSKNLGLGGNILKTLGVFVVALAGLMLMAMLSTALAARRYDLAVMRVLGARPRVLGLVIVLEALIVSLAGGIAGIVAGHALAFAVMGMNDTQGLVFASQALHVSLMDIALLGLSAGAGLLAALVPALSAARIDIADLLARGRI